MVERAYMSVLRAESPRLIEIAAPGAGGSDEAVAQDIHDTLNSNTLPAGDPDDSLDNMDDDFMISSAGKEELGGDVEVSITSTLQNAQLFFAGEPMIAEYVHKSPDGPDVERNLASRILPRNLLRDHEHCA